MFKLHRTKLLITSAFAVVLSVASTAALATAMTNEGDGSDNDVKSLACGAIGCANGGRLCGTAGGSIKAIAPPFLGEISVNFTCYEAVYEF